MATGEAILTSADAVRLSAIVGPTTFARGRAYAAGGAVVARTGEVAGVVVGMVQGSRGEPYEAAVRLIREEDGRLAKMAGECTCPVGWNCKHCVAVLLDAPARPRPAPAPAAPAQWATLLAPLLGDERDERDDREAPSGIAIQFELVAQRPRPATRTRNPPPPEPGIRVRPVLRSDRGNWVRTGVSWSRLPYLGHGFRSGPAHEHIDVLRELQALAGVGETGGWTRYGDEVIWLESINSRRIWDLLAEATEVGVPFLGSGKAGGPVTLDDRPAEVVLDLSGSDGGHLTLRPVIGGTDNDLDETGRLPIGRPVHGVARWYGPVHPNRTPEIRLTPLTGSLPESLRSVLMGGPIVIDDRDGFAAAGLPRLRRRLRVTSRDGTVDLPEMLPDRVVATVTSTAGPVIEVDWALEGGTEPPRPLTERPDWAAGRTLAVVTAALDRDLLVEVAPGRRRPADVRLSGFDAVRFVEVVVPRLRQIDGLELRLVGDLPDFREVTQPPVVRFVGAGDETGAQEDWFDLRVEIEVDDEEVPFADVFAALADGSSHMLLPSGAYFVLESPELRRLSELIAEARMLNDAPQGKVRVTPYQSSFLEELADIGEVDSPWLERLRALAADPMSRPVPAGLAATLRPYQHDGFQWLAARFERGQGAVLADDMGLGKTVQALAVMLHAREAMGVTAPFLVVAPTSVVGNWASEAARFAPGLECVALTETTRRARSSLAAQIGRSGLVMTSYALFRLDHSHYEEIEWAGLLLDEAQFAKNPASHANQWARRLAAPWKLAMTGTPLENSLSELWALLAITAPGVLGRPDRFDEFYRRPVERYGDEVRLAQLRRRLRPLMLRRTKEEVASDLPAKQETVLELELDPRHRRLYETYLQRERQKVLGLLGDMRSNRFEILRSLTLLRQAALDLSLVDPEHAAVPSAKLDELGAMLSGIVADGHRALVFSQFTRFLGTARRTVEDLGIECCYLDGGTRRRAAVIDRFRSGGAPVFMISLKAGGFGLNLTEADYCILLDPWWNPATEAQAVDRAHRIGQTRPVMVYRLVSKDTIEEKVMALKARKSQLFDSVVGGGAFESAALSADDIRSLLA